MKKVILIILLIIWMITVFCFSNQAGEKSGGTSKKVIEIVFKIFGINPTEEKINNFQLPIRKLAHFTLYAVGGLIAILLFSQFNLSFAKRIIFSQALISFYAFTDEFHQYFIPGRSALFTDVLIDSAGAFLTIILISIIFLKKL